MAKKIGVLLSGCGVYDGSEIHEAVLTLLELDKLGVETICIAPDVDQHHVINHLTGEEMNGKRNVLVESARIARGNIKPLSEVSADELDGLAMPGGFGAAKNLTKWAFSGPDGDILPEVKQLIQDIANAGKPIASVCISPAVLAKAFEGTNIHPEITVGTTHSPSPYDIAATNDGLFATGAKAVLCDVEEMVVDIPHKIITSPCYMMEASISQVAKGISKAMAKLVELA